MKTSGLIGAALDWAVAMCEGYFAEQPEYWVTAAGAKHFMGMRDGDVHWTHSSTDWSQGGPIIEREKIATVFKASGKWFAYTYEMAGKQAAEYGTTPLIAAMRCYVASKLGDDIELPRELA